MHRKYHNILDVHPDLICRCDTLFSLSFVNSAFSKFFNEDLEFFIEKNLFDLVQNTQKEEFRHKIQTITVENPQVTILSTRLGKNKELIELEWTIIGLFDDNGHLEEYQSLGRDVTKENALQSKLRARNEELEAAQKEMRMVLDAIPCKIWYKDEKNTILKLNTMAADSMGMKVEDIEGKNTYDLFGSSAKKYHVDDLKVMDSGKPLIGIIERYTPNDGTQGWVQTDKIPFDYPGSKEKRILVVSTDITNLKEQESVLKAVNRNLDDFASLASHDLQSPLRQISVATQYLLKDAGFFQNPDSATYLKAIKENALQMRTLIQSLLKFMRSSAGSVDLNKVNLSTVIHNVCERYRAGLRDIGAQLNLPKGDIYVLGKEHLLEQVIINLVENAIKYRELTRPLEISITAEQFLGEWTISVADNGLGIPPNMIDTVFEIFGRTKSHANREGHGIGLAICKRIIILHGGAICAKPGSDHGTEFLITLKGTKLN